LCFIGFSKINHTKVFQYYCLNPGYNPSYIQVVFVLIYLIYKEVCIAEIPAYFHQTCKNATD